MNEYGDKINQAVAGELRAHRARTRMTFDKLAAEVGLAKATVLKYLNGQRSIPLPALADLCRALGLRMDELFVLALKSAEQD